jgi:hypothetical protein
MNTALTFEPFEELAHRSTDGIEVLLIWDRTEDDLRVHVDDTRSCTSFSLSPARDEALDAFYHPFAYAASRGIEYAETSVNDRPGGGNSPAVAPEVAPAETSEQTQ